MSTREASHAGSWYTSNGTQLARQLDSWLAAVPEDALPGADHLPIPGSRAIISPHAGYAYSGPAAAWAFKCLDLSKAKRIFILHPSHHYHLRAAALPTLTAYETPLDDEPLPLDVETIKHLSTLDIADSNGRPVKFSTMSHTVDEAEHSCEMQLPYIHRLLQKLYPDKPASTYPPLVPIMIGNTEPDTEKAIGKMLAPYIADESNSFVISSDFCHWGSRFSYMFYISNAPSPAVTPLTLPNGVRGGSNATAAQDPASDDVHKAVFRYLGRDLVSYAKPSKPAIFESIAHVDRACMCAIATGQYSEFNRVLFNTGNTVCGRHPIGVFMAGIEEVEKGEDAKDEDTLKRRFRFTRYERSSDAITAKDSSVSYVSAFAVL